MLTTKFISIGITFHVSDKPETLAGDLKRLDTTQAIADQRTVAILIDGRKPRAVPGPTGGLPFIGSYSEIYPDFIGNYQRLLDKYGHLVHVRYLGRDVYLTDDPESQFISSLFERQCLLIIPSCWPRFGRRRNLLKRYHRGPPALPP